MTVRLLIADDHRIIRQGLISMINKEVDMKVIAEAENGFKALELAEQLQPDVIIMDIEMPEMNGIEATKNILSSLPDVKVIALSMYSEIEFVAEMFLAGSVGYMLKNSAFNELISAVKTVSSGKRYLSPSITEAVIADWLVLLAKQEKPAGVKLSSRENEVLILLAQGNNTKEIAYELELSVKTIESHRQKIMQKLNLFSVAELTKYAIRKGLSTL